MRKYAVLGLLIACGVSGLRAVPARELRARSAVERLIGASGAEVAVALRTLDGRDELFIAAAESLHAASTMKIPAMIELFDQVQAGKVRLDERPQRKHEIRRVV